MTKIQLHPSVPHPNATFGELPIYAAFTFGPNPPELYIKIGRDSAICFRSDSVSFGSCGGSERVFFLELLTIEAVVRPFSVE